MTPQEIAELVVKTLDGKKAHDIKLLHTTDVTVLADYFVLCTATSTTQIKTLADEVEHAVETAGEAVHHREGYRSGGWVLIDLGCVVVHLFMDETRKFYNLERLWADAKEIDISQMIGEQMLT